MEIEMDDLRSQKRRKSSLSLLITYPSLDGSEKVVQHTCNTRDISESGLKIVARRPLPLGSLIPIEIFISETNSKFRFNGEVKWCLEIDASPTFYAGIKLLEIVENTFDNWLAVAAGK